MTLSHSVGLAAMTLSVVLWSTAAGAQSNDQRRRVPPDDHGRSAPHGQASQPRSGQRSADQRERHAQPRQPAPAPAPRTADGARRAAPQRRAVPRGRSAAPPRSRAYREPRAYGYSRPRVAVPVIVYPRRYYAFHPRLWIGFGLYIGVPVAYPLVYGPPTYIYPDVYAPSGVAVQGTYGGVSFDVIPADADVSVDGVYVGVAADFSPNHQPLTLTPGRHHVELQSPGMAPIAFDVDVVPGEVIPFQGRLLP